MSSEMKELCVLPMECIRGFRKSWGTPIHWFWWIIFSWVQSDNL